MKRSVRTGAAMLTLAMGVSLFAGCGSSNEPKKVGETNSNANQKAQKITMRVVSFAVGEDPFKPAWQATLKNFQDQNPNVEIIDESTPDANDALRTKVKTDFASGNEPDFLWFYNGSDAKPLIDSGKLFTFDEELKKDTGWSESITPGAIEAGKQNGKVYSIPVVGFYEALFVNKDLFDANGLKVPTNFEEFNKAVDTFKAKDIIPIGASIDESYYLLEYFVLSAAGKEGHAAEFKNTVPADWAKGIAALKEYYEKGAFPKDALTISDEAARNLFYDKKAAMMINGSWSVGQVKDTKNTVVTYFPVIKDGKAGPKDVIGGFGTGFYLSKDQNDKKNGLPLKLLKYMSSPEIVKTLTEKAGIPGVKIDTGAASPVAKSGLDMFAGATSVSFPFGDRIDKEAFTNIRKNLAYVVTGKKSAEELLNESLKLVKK